MWAMAPSARNAGATATPTPTPESTRAAASGASSACPAPHVPLAPAVALEARQASFRHAATGAFSAERATISNAKQAPARDRHAMGDPSGTYLACHLGTRHGVSSMKVHARGFTLIEMMIVVAIIALLSAIALPLYRQQQARAAEKACLAEMKTYANFVIAAIANDDTLPVPSIVACASIDTATASSVSIDGTPRLPGTRITTCNMATANCAIAP